MDEKVMVFIDGSNLHHAVERYAKTDSSFVLDYKKLIETLVGGRRFVRAYYYGSRPGYGWSLSRDDFMDRKKRWKNEPW